MLNLAVNMLVMHILTVVHNIGLLQFEQSLYFGETVSFNSLFHSSIMI